MVKDENGEDSKDKHVNLQHVPRIHLPDFSHWTTRRSRTHSFDAPASTPQRGLDTTHLLRGYCHTAIRLFESGPCAVPASRDPSVGAPSRREEGCDASACILPTELRAATMFLDLIFTVHL